MEKERRTKALVIVVLLIVVAGLTIAFAALSSSLNIKGTAYLDAAKWGIKFENLSEAYTVGTATTTGTPKIEESKSAEITGINVSLSTPGDQVVYDVDLVNEGTINAKIDKIEKATLTEEQQKYLTFKVTDASNIELKEGDILSAGESKWLRITIGFKEDLSKEDLPTNVSTISLSYKLNFVQTDERATTSSSSKKEQACTTFDKKDTYSKGDVIALCTTTNKSEDFYVIKDNGTTVTALAKYNLLIGYTKIDDNNYGFTISTTPISETEKDYGLQSSDTVPYDYTEENHSRTLTRGLLAFYNSNDGEYGYWWDKENDTFFSKYEKDSSGYAYVFDSNSNLYEPLQNYKNYLRNTLGKTSVTTRLLTMEESGSTGWGCDSSAPSWLYTVRFWTGTAGDYKAISQVGRYCNWDFPDYEAGGLRPVITINKSEL